MQLKHDGKRTGTLAVIDNLKLSDWRRMDPLERKHLITVSLLAKGKWVDSEIQRNARLEEIGELYKQKEGGSWHDELGIIEDIVRKKEGLVPGARVISQIEMVKTAMERGDYLLAAYIASSCVTNQLSAEDIFSEKAKQLETLRNMFIELNKLTSRPLISVKLDVTIRKVLDELGENKFVELMIGILQDKQEKPALRYLAVAKLADFYKHDDARNCIDNASRDDNPDIRKFAREVLETWRDKHVIWDGGDWLEKSVVHDP